MNQKTVFVVAGEASGDAHAGRMIAQLKQLNSEVNVTGVGGDNLRNAGANIKIDFSELAVMGLVEVLKRYRHIKKIFNQVVTLLKSDRPDLLILVDYPGFNLKLAKVAKKLGIPVMYYISPKVWASRKGRIKSIKRNVDHMAVLFPFEKTMYDQAGVTSTCVGHPLVDAVKRTLSIEQAKAKFHLDPHHRVLGLYPGSRRSEVEALLPVMIEAAQRIHQNHYDVQYVIPIAPGLDKDVIAPILKQTQLPIKLVDHDFYQLTSACDAIIAASGTVTLEIALLGVPHLIAYRVSPLTYKILKHIVHVPYIGLCNIVTERPVIKELLQDEVTAQRLEQELIELLTRPDSKAKAESIRQQVLAALGPAGGAENAAKQILTMLETTQTT